MQKVTEHVYVETGYIGSNVGCVVTEQGLVTVDCPLLPAEIEDWREKLAEVSDKEVVYAISTDHHFDHSIADGLFCRRIIAHKVAHKGMKYFQARDNRAKVFKQFFPELYEENRQFFDNMEVLLPQLVFSQDLRLNMGDCSIELSFVGGHAPSTILICIPEDRVIFLGDNLENGNYPYTGEARYGQWIELLKSAELMDVAVMIPGHGEPCGMEAAQKLRSYFEEMRDQVKLLRQSGLTRSEVIEKSELKGLPSWSVIPGMNLETQMATDVGRMYDQVEKGLI